MKTSKAVFLLAALALIGATCAAATLPRLKISTFGSPQARILNNVIEDVETALNAAVIVDTNATTTVTAYTPVEVGQLLVGGAGTGTNALWFAAGLTTNDWTQISSYVE